MKLAPMLKVEVVFAGWPRLTHKVEYAFVLLIGISSLEFSYNVLLAGSQYNVDSNAS